MKKVQLGTSHFKICCKVTVGKCISVNSHVCWRIQWVSRRLWAWILPRLRGFLSPVRVKTTLVCVLYNFHQLMFMIYFFSIQGSFLPCNSSTWGSQQVKGISWLKDLFMIWSFHELNTSRSQPRALSQTWANLKSRTKCQFFSHYWFFGYRKAINGM